MVSAALAAGAMREARTRARRRGAVDSSGTALIEFAIVLPLLLLLIVGIFDFGMLFQRYEVLTNAAREGARLAVLPGYSTADVISRVNAYLAAADIDDEAVTLTVQVAPVTPATGPPFTVVTVDAHLPYTFPFLGPIGALFGTTFGTVSLPARVVMRTEAGAGA